MRYERVLVDALAARMVGDPLSLDVVVASNLFGDVLTDIAAELQGGMGMAASASVAPGSGGPGIFEPVHGSAPDIAGRGIANPIGAIWSAALMLEHLGETDAHARVLQAIEDVCREGPRTRDLGGVAGTSEVGDAVAARVCPSSPAWWRTAVFYEIYVRSFADSDGDGIGDLPGIQARLPYLRDLGVDCVWLTPFYPSPGADHGYDVSDYVDVDPQFGTLADFDALVAEAHGLGLRLIVDIVPNHTSVEHPWFRNAISDPNHPDRARYIFRPGRDGGPPNNWTSPFGGAAWTLDDTSGEWYLQLFTPEQPDLDWHNEEVQRDFEQVLRFWLDRGIDGFRIDVAQALFKARDLRGRAGAREADAVRRLAHRPATARAARPLPALARARRRVRGRADVRRRDRDREPARARRVRPARRAAARVQLPASCTSGGTPTRCGGRSTARGRRSTRSAPRPRGCSRTTT